MSNDNWPPHAFADAAQIDVRRLNENIQALTNMVRNEESLRYTRSQLVLQFPFIDHTTSSANLTYRFNLPFDYEIEGLWMMHKGDSGVTSATLTINGLSLTVDGDGAGGFVEGAQSSNLSIAANTDVDAVLSVDNSAGSYHLGGCTAVVNVRVDAMRDTSLTADYARYKSGDSLTAAKMNTLFTDFAADMDQLRDNAATATNAVKANCSMIFSLDMNGAAIPAAAEYRNLPASAYDTTRIDHVDFYAWTDPSVTVTWEYDPGTPLTTNATAPGTAGPHLITSTIAGPLLQGSSDRLRFSSAGVCYRVWAVVHFIPSNF